MSGTGEGDDDDTDMALLDERDQQIEVVCTFMGGLEDDSCLDVDATLRLHLDVCLVVLEG